MRAVQNKKPLFTLVEGQTKSGKPCIHLVLNEFRLDKEYFGKVRDAVGIEQGFSYMALFEGKLRPTYMKVSKATLQGILNELPKEAWVKPEAKATKVKGSKVKAVLTAEKDAQINALSKQVANLTKLIQGMSGAIDGPDSDLPF